MLHEPFYVDGIGRVGVTRHADKRLRQRMGLRRSAVPRTVRLALERGLRIKAPDDLPEACEGNMFCVWAGFVFVFRRDEDRVGVACVTVLREMGDAERAEETQRRAAREQRGRRRRHYRRRCQIQRARSRNIEQNAWRGL